ncbi:MAG: aminopeptidase [Bacillaceae bacterium]
MSNFEQQLEKYAELAITTGVNIQEGQTLQISASFEAAPLVRKIAEKAYLRGAKFVTVDWSDDAITHIRFKNASDSSFEEFPKWRADATIALAEEGAAFLSIYAPNPDLLKDIDPKRIAANAKAQSIALEKYRERMMSDKNRWSIIAAPTEKWAQKVFPGLSTEDAIEKMWETIFYITRVDKEDPIQAWSEHNTHLLKAVNYLNEKAYASLVYSAPGTDLTIDLPEGHRWHGGAATSPDGLRFNPNMPTEEAFTMPHKDGVNGTVQSTKPLNYGGNVIDNFSLTFKDGKVVDFTAEKGYETLKNLLASDEGSVRLGEVALVPHDSPISNSNLIFYNTLFDENASCHLALGAAYPTTIKGGVDMTKEELAAHGVNSSLIHEDFMIGCAEMNIDGVTKDGKREPIFRNGNWAIEL